MKYRQLYPISEEVPRFYGLPKVYKANHPLRLIIACSDYITYASAKLIVDILIDTIYEELIFKRGKSTFVRN